MRKSLLALSAALVAVSGMAANPQQLQVPASANLCFDKSVELKSTGNIRVDRSKSSVNKAPAKVSSADIITSVEGKVQGMSTTASGFYVNLFWIFEYADQSTASQVVYGDNDEVYFLDILPNASVGAYVKGVKKDNKVEISLPQTVLYYDSYGYGFNLVCMEKYTEVDEEGNELIGYEKTDASSFTFTVAEDGSMVADGISDELILGYAYTDDDSWAGYGVTELSMTPFDGEPVTPPADIEVSKNFWLISGAPIAQPVNWAQGYDEVYFQGLSANMPEGWVKGTVEYDDSFATISIAQDQYLGIAYSQFIYTKCAKMIYDEDGTLVDAELMPADYQYQLIWDYEENTITAKDPEVSFVLNAAQDRVYYLDYFTDLKLIHQDSFEGTPANPTGLEFNETIDSDGYNSFFFEVPAVSTDGDYLLTDDLYYVVYVDGEEWECDAEEYEIDESLVEIPWGFSAYYIYNYGGTRREVDFFVEGISTVGVQSVYKYDGVETRSEIVTLDLESGSKVNALDADKKVAKVAYYDIAGRAVANPANGLFIKKTTYTDGSVVSTKSFIR